MKKLFATIVNHVKSDFHPFLYLLILIFLAVTVSINYAFDLENSVIDAYYGQNIRILWYFILYATGYFPIAILIAYIRKDYFIYNKEFWIYSIAGIFIVSFSAGFHHINNLNSLFDIKLKSFAFKIFSNTKSLVTVLFPLLFFKVFVDKKQDSFYGFRMENPFLKSYIIMLLIMIPLIGWASYQKDFLHSYPVYKSFGVHTHYNIPEWITIAIFELAYGWDFIATELLFRGFLVIGMARIIGKEAILPMVTVYAFLHFGKPMAETIGSVFGGYVLGILAFYSRNIWGGIFIHLGVAWLMELAAFIQKNM